METSAAKLYDTLCSYVRETALLESLEELAGWDERTFMPVAAGAYRAEQLTCLAGIIHQRRTDPRLGDWLAQLSDSQLAEDPHSDAGTTIRQLLRDYNKLVKLPNALVQRLTRATVLGQQVWVRAKRENDFSVFEPALREIIELKREQAEAIGYETCRYDVLLDDFEPGETTANLTRVLCALRQELVPLVAQISASERRSTAAILRRDYPVGSQEAFGISAARAIGFDFERGRLDVTHHPFCASLGPDDCRLTTRYDERYFSSAFFGVLHEAGHGLYEQGLRREFHGLPPGSFVSLGIHESQSRLWENIVGRGYPFWEYHYRSLQQAFPEALADVALDDFYFAINEVRPSLIRVDADEATYGLHIIVRFELEQALIDGDLDTKDLPGAWNQKYEEYLGVVPSDDATGVLQDIHWSAGFVGYFPTYALGSLYAAQFYQQARRDLDDLELDLARGSFSRLQEWLQENIHQRGQCYSPGELVERVTGQALNHSPMMNHLYGKLSPLYGLKIPGDG